MRIIHVIDSLSSGGAELLLKNTLPLLTSTHHTVCYLGGNSKLLNSFREYDVICLGYNSLFDLPKAVFKLKSIIKKAEFGDLAGAIGAACFALEKNKS